MEPIVSMLDLARQQSRYRGNETETLAFLLGCLAGIPTLVLFVQLANWKDLSVYAALAIALILMFHHLLPPPTDRIPRGTVFPGVGNTDQPSALWRRTRDTDSVYRSLWASKHKLCVITGVSGAGKSVLVRHLVAPKFHDWHVVIVDNYDAVQVELPRRLNQIFRSTAEQIRTCSFDPKTDERQGTLFIFDQAEQLGARNEAEMNWVRDFITACLNSEDVRCAVVVRQDFYFDLRFLCQILPNPTDVIDLPGIPSNPNSQELQELRHALTRICTSEVADVVIRDLETPFRETICDKGNHLTRTTQVILPLELQMLGFVLDLEWQRIGPVGMREYHQLLGKTGLTRQYFLTYLSACDNTDIAWAVLFALSADSVIQRTVSLDHLEKVTYYGRKDIKKVLDLFQDEKLIVSPQPGIYQWSHDALWSGFREISAAEMDPALRDNISYLTERHHHSEGFCSRILALGDPELDRRQFWMRLSFSVVTAVIVIAMLRDYTRLKQPDFQLQSFYLPFGFADLMWALYLYRVRWLYIRLTKGSQTFFRWWFTPVAGIGSAVVSAWCPRSWLYCLGFSAIVFGLGLLMPSLRQGLSSQSKTKFRALARDCGLFGGLICGVVGSVYFFFVDQLAALFGRSNFFLWSAGLGFVFSLVAFLTMQDRASSSSVTMYLGFLDRTSRSGADVGGGLSVHPAMHGSADGTVAANVEF